MIIIGYQGIGKSTLAGLNKYIDLESGNFWVDGKRNDNWYIVYANIAKHLSDQGFIVFVSSHRVVRKELAKYKNDTKIYIACPDIALKEEWIDKLNKRYENSQLEKDYKAMRNAQDLYNENIQELNDDNNFGHIIIPTMNYNLKELIESAL